MYLLYMYPCWIAYDTTSIPGTPGRRSSKPDAKIEIQSRAPTNGFVGKTRVGKWEEVYDAVDGTKTWYNTVTKTKTKTDPFW